MGVDADTTNAEVATVKTFRRDTCHSSSGASAIEADTGCCDDDDAGGGVVQAAVHLKPAMVTISHMYVLRLVLFICEL
jgi:hypothetical protein